MTAHRFTVLDGDLARSFDNTTRLGDVIGALHRAAQAPRRGKRPTKLGGKTRTVEAIRAEQIAACKAALDEIDAHGPCSKLTAALTAIVPALVNAEVKRRLLDALEDRGVEIDRAGARKLTTDAAPVSGVRTLLAGDTEYKRLRWAALDAFDRIAGGRGAGVVQLGMTLTARTRRELADAANDLSIACHEPRKGAVPGVARMCAALARGLHSDAGEQAAKACAALAEYVERWTAERAGGDR